MRIVKTVQALHAERRNWGSSVGFVPTMGYLHEGHLSLLRQARKECQTVVASIFVNPTQFAPHEDLSRYPRDVARDLSLLETVGADVVFLPTTDEIYPSAFVTYVEPTGPLAQEAEGAFRPHHFRGVATVVLKLFQIVQPDLAYFGQKDAQQVAVITRMVADLHLWVTVRVLPTVREEDGLALSSRNTYLDPVSRHAATTLYRALQAGQRAFTTLSQDDPTAVIRAMQAVVAEEPLVQLDYLELRQPSSFLTLERLQTPALLLIAARVGAARLIDNFMVHADGTWETGRRLSELAIDP